MTLIEVVVSITVISLMATSVIQALLMSERYSSTARLFTSARVIVQRNLSAAMEVGFATSGTTAMTPLVLRSTPATGSICDDDYGSTTENISVLLSGTSTGVVTTGTLTRTVSQLPASSFSSSADAGVVMKVSFQVDYDYRNKHYTYSQTTLRAQDIQ